MLVFVLRNNCHFDHVEPPRVIIIYMRVYAELVALVACQRWVCKLTKPQIARMIDV